MTHAALAVFAALAVAGCGASRTADLAADPRQERELVNPLAADDFAKFVVVDMADAVERVSRVEVAAQER
ncbi:MAG: hypothetical protein ACREI7_02530 [Myxococcota bacterium]